MFSNIVNSAGRLGWYSRMNVLQERLSIKRYLIKYHVSSDSLLVKIIKLVIIIPLIHYFDLGGELFLQI